MGFNYFGFGCIQPCRVEDGFVIRKLPSGAEQKYPTRLDVNIPEQLNLFLSPNILFYLKKDGLEYIGRKDGSISIYQEKDDLLVGLNNWDVSPIPFLQVCGYKMFGKTTHAYIYQDKFDQQSIYATNINLYSSVLPRKMEMFWDMRAAEIGWVMQNDPSPDYIFAKRGGERIAVDRWEVQNIIRSTNCKRFV